MTPTYHVRLGNTDWFAWRDALLRSTGFPASGLLKFAAPECAVAADAFITRLAARAEFDKVFEETVTDISVEVNRVAADSLLREAITWQSPAAAGLLDSLLRNHEPIRRNAKRRYREEQLSKFWQRYSAKAETIGFFGPSLWITLDPGRRDVHASPGARLIDRRQVSLEPWAVIAYGEWLATDEETRRWLPPARQPHHFIESGRVHRPGQSAVPVSDTEIAVLRACDGKRPAVLVARELTTGESAAFEGVEEVYRLLNELVRRRLATWDANIPLSTTGEAVLEQRIASIGDLRLRDQAQVGLDRLRTARDAVAKAAGDPAALAAAQDHLSTEFTEITGRSSRRRSGGTYAGRGLCYEDTTRDLEVSLGGDFLDALAAPLDIVMQTARWLTVAMAEAYEERLLSVYREHHAGLGRDLSLADLWAPILRLFMGAGEKPADVVMRDFVDRWADLLGLDEASAGRRTLELSSDAMATRIRELFPAAGPGWEGGRIHSPDLHICAPSVQAVNDGDYLVVLGELHAAVGTMEGNLFGWSLDDPRSVVERLAEDQGNDRVMPLFPVVWPRNAGRVVPFEYSSSDHFLGFSPAPGADLERTTSIAAIPLSVREDRVWGSVGGREIPLLHVLSAFLAMKSADAYKLVSAGEHTPRITLDRLVLFRETWRTTAEATELLPVRSEADEFLAARRWRRRHRLPERCFVKISTEPKPVYVDLTSPLYVSSLCAALRAAQRSTKGEVGVTVTEMLPTPEQAWVPGPEGEFFFGEIRMHVLDTQPCVAP
ncbi:lantibiotic dehydratase [Streptomyces sp. SP17KL33]|uniref:lantibiotic dehydratase n=1 Tax=Streptomyces sp. SP17KL33 TaxID=3002534 RepID=UPI002E79DDAF|nr:lantibiotic dehydratase [Streptomyces sp. SP17KL33]MEE1831706.1 lantibiotic dehydratase [Streptomyces sp. SP17KL33]